MKTYVTFGQVHQHEIDGQIFDKDCLALIYHEKQGEGRKRAFELFSNKFAMTYQEPNQDFLNQLLEFFPRGIIEIK